MDKIEYIQNALKHYKDDIVQLVADNVEINLDANCNFQHLKNYKAITLFLQKHFNLARSGYPISQRNYWIQRGFSKEEADENIKQFSACYSRSAESISKKYNCTPEEAQAILKQRMDKARVTKENLPEEEKQRIKASKRQGKEDFIRRWGEEEGLKRYNARIEKFRKSNSLEALIERYGSEEKAKEVLKQRKESMKSSLDALIKRHGEEEGRRRYELQIQRKAKSQTLEGYIERYGMEEGIKRFDLRQKRFLQSWANKPAEEIARINKLKSNSLQSLQAKYGAIEGQRRYNEARAKRHCMASKSSLCVFKPLHWWLVNEMHFDDKDILYGLDEKYEKSIMINNEFFSYDFCIESLKVIFEYNGLLFHPKNPDDPTWKMMHNPEVGAKEKYEFDQHKNQVARDAGYKVIILWDDVEPTSNIMYAMNIITQLIEEQKNNEAN